MFVGPDGARCYNEVGENRHGRVKIAGEFRPVDHPEKAWFLWDQTRMDELGGMGVVGALSVLAEEKYVKADTLEQLVEACGMDADVLTAQIANWAFFAEQGCDYQFGRDAATIRAFVRYISGVPQRRIPRGHTSWVSYAFAPRYTRSPGSMPRGLAQAALGLLG